jgi:hypothetical protein
MRKQALLTLLLLTFTFLFSSIVSVQAQDSFLNRFDIGGAVTYSTMNYESYGDFLNENLSHDYGYKFHLHYNHQISEKVTLLTGLEYLFFSYTFEDLETIETNENGDPTGRYFTTTMKEEFSSTHLLLPVRFKYHPLPEFRAYITAGAELSYKIGFENGTTETVLYTEDGAQTEDLFVDEYNIPETANDLMVNGTAGIGYSFNPGIPITAEVRFTQSLTPYRSGNGYINSYMQGFTFALSYRL